MESEHKMFACIWVAVVSAIVLTVFGFVYMSYKDDQTIADMVAKGADPIDAGCAIHNSSMNNSQSLCLSRHRQ